MGRFINARMQHHSIKNFFSACTFAFALFGATFHGHAADKSSVSQSLAKDVRIIRGDTVPSRSSAVAKIIGQDEGGQYLCSGALVSPRVVLTASHCVPPKASQLAVYIKGAYRSASKIIVHPEAHENQFNGVIYYDIALVYLSRPVAGNYYSVLSSRKSLPGDTIKIYGYGVDDNGQVGTLKQGVMSVDSSTGLFIFARYDGFDSSNTCNGDSGGPAIRSYVDGKRASRTGIVGVTSGGQNADCGPGDLSYFSNLQNAATLQFLKRNVRGIVFK